MSNQFEPPQKPKGKEEEETLNIEKVFAFSNYLKKSRERSGKDIKEVADKFGVKVERIEALENGEEDPRLEKLPKLAAAYGVSYEELLEKFNITKEARKGELKTLRDALNPPAPKIKLSKDAEIVPGQGKSGRKGYRAPRS